MPLGRIRGGADVLGALWLCRIVPLGLGRCRTHSYSINTGLCDGQHVTGQYWREILYRRQRCIHVTPIDFFDLFSGACLNADIEKSKMLQLQARDAVIAPSSKVPRPQVAKGSAN